ncbi:2471_t:CDS:2, partial [Diversispora eburnea]
MSAITSIIIIRGELSMSNDIPYIKFDGALLPGACTYWIRSSRNYATVLELLVTTSLPKLDEHFKWVFDYSDQLKPSE